MVGEGNGGEADRAGDDHGGRVGAAERVVVLRGEVQRRDVFGMGFKAQTCYMDIKAIESNDEATTRMHGQITLYDNITKAVS